MNLVTGRNFSNFWTGRPVPKWALISGVILFLLIGLGTTRHFYLGWREKRLVRAARVSLQANDFAALNRALDKVLLLNPKNTEACRLSAQALMKLGNAKALPWLRRVVELQPESFEDQMALAEAALRFNHQQEAVKWMQVMEAAAKNRADYQDLAGRLAESSEQQADAQAHYAKAAELAPANKTYQLHLASMRLKSQDPAVREAARSVVEGLVAVPELHATALRALVVDALKELRPERALTMAADLDALPDHLFSDRLLYLQVLHLTSSSQFHVRLAETEEAAARSPEWVLPLLTWMNANHLGILARDWSQRLPKAAVASTPVRLEIARSYAVYGDWKQMQFFLASEKWGDLEYMRKAFLARCYQERDKNDIISRTAWSEALNATENNGESLLTLARTAMQWGWQKETEETLWFAVAKSGKSAEALNGLSEFYFSKRDTAGLYRVYSMLQERNPGDPAIRNNLANFCLLLDKDVAGALNIARELHDKQPASPVFASTYAFALYRNGKGSEALAVMGALKSEELNDPSVAAYYSAFLASAGRSEEAEKYRELAKGASLLPEEEKLLNLAPPDSKKPDTGGELGSPTNPEPAATPAVSAPVVEAAAAPAVSASSAEPATK